MLLSKIHYSSMCLFVIAIIASCKSADHRILFGNNPDYLKTRSVCTIAGCISNFAELSCGDEILNSDYQLQPDGIENIDNILRDLISSEEIGLMARCCYDIYQHCGDEKSGYMFFYAYGRCVNKLSERNDVEAQQELETIRKCTSGGDRVMLDEYIESKK